MGERLKNLAVLIIIIASLGCTQKSSVSSVLGTSLSGSAGSTSVTPTPNPTASPVVTPTPSPTPKASTTPTATPSASPTATGGACSSSTGVASYFPCSIYFNQDVTTVSISGANATYSNDVINNLNSRGGWGNGNSLQIDFSIDVYQANAGTGHFTVNTSDPNWYSPDSDLPSSVPAPPSGSSSGFESGSGRTCDGGDCHYLVLDPITMLLSEVYGANVSGTTLGNEGYGSIASWPFNKSWPANFRGDVCTSADAGGLMIAPLLFSAAELQAGAINHAIRFILPNNRIASFTYVRPSSHTTGGSTWAPAPVSGASDPFANVGVPYGTRLRLKPNIILPPAVSSGGMVVIRALQHYGMFLADGGNIALTAQKGADSFIGSRDLSFIKVTDFEVIPPPPVGVMPPTAAQGGPRTTTLNGNVITISDLSCVRNP